MGEEQVSFVSDGLTLYGVFHRAEVDSTLRRSSGQARPAVVFCHPFAEERKCAHRIMVECARALCTQGIDVLRFDLRGCGDSEGEFGQATLSGWLNDLDVALQWLNQTHHAKAVGLLGLRLGAALVAQCAEQHPEVRWLGLWEPITDGAQYWRLSLRRQQIRQAITETVGQASSLPGRLETCPTNYDLDGYEVSDAMRQEVEQLSLLKQSRSFADRVWIAQISASPRASRNHLALQQAYQAAGGQCELEAVMGEPFWSLLGLARAPELIARTVGATRQLAP